MAGLILIALISEVCSPPAALVVLACAVVRAAGCHAFCPKALLADSHPPPFNNQPHTSKKSRQPLFVRPLLNPSHIPWPSHSSHRASPRASASRSLLTPYLLLAVSLRGGHFVRLRGSQYLKTNRTSITQFNCLSKS